MHVPPEGPRSWDFVTQLGNLDRIMMGDHVEIEWLFEDEILRLTLRIYCRRICNLHSILDVKEFFSP